MILSILYSGQANIWRIYSENEMIGYDKKSLDNGGA